MRQNSDKPVKSFFLHNVFINKNFFSISIYLSTGIYIYIYIYIYIFGCAESSQLRRLLSSHCVQASHCNGFLCCRARALGHMGSVLWLQGSRVWAQQLWLMGLAALHRVGSSWIRDRTRVSCTGSGFSTTEPPGKPCWYIFNRKK